MKHVLVHCGLCVPYVARMAAGTPWLERYAERSLVLARKGDVVCLPHTVDGDYLAFLESLGLGPLRDDILMLPSCGPDANQSLPQRILESTDFFGQLVQRLGSAGDVGLAPFIASRGHVELAVALERATGASVRVCGGPELVANADRKDWMRAKARELGLPVAEGEVIRIPYFGTRRRQDVAALCDAVVRHLDRTGRVLIRGASGASGSSSFIVGHGGYDLATVVAEIIARADNDAYLVESMVDATASPNVQVHIAPEDGAVTCLGVTEQRWRQPLSHAGNAFPCEAETVDAMIEASFVVAHWLKSQGYFGVAGLDFVEYRDPATGRPCILFAELNPRINGSTFPLALFERLNTMQRQACRPESRAFVSGAVETSTRSFAELRASLGPLLYSSETGTGAVPYVSSVLPLGKYQVAVLGRSSDEALGAFEEVQRAGASAEARTDTAA